MNLPFHKYIGPGNKLNNGPPQDLDDIIAEEHDIAYSQAKKQSDIESADLHAISDFISDSGNPHSSLGALALVGKYGAEKIFGPLYGMSHHKSPKYQSLLGVHHDPQYDQESPEREERPEEPQPKKPKINILSNKTVRKANKETNYYDPNQVEIEQAIQRQIGIAQPQKHQRAADYFHNFIPSGESNNMGMEEEMGAPGDVLGTGVGTKAGAGPGMGSAGSRAIDAPNVIDLGGRVPGVPFKHSLQQSYRFVIPASLTQHKITNVSSVAASDTQGGNSLWSHDIKLGSSVCVDMELLFQYMDPSTLKHLITHTTETNVHNASLEVWSLGVRAPYTTNTSNIEVANANLQAQILDYSPIQEDYAIDFTDDNMLGKTHGNTYQITPESSFTTTWSNVSARMETRALRQRAIIRDYFYADGPSSAPIFNEWDVKPSEPNMNQYILDSKNGSNLLGLAFKHHYNVSGQIASNHGTQRLKPEPLITAEGFDLQADNNVGNIIQYNNPLDANDKPTGGINSNDQGFDMQQGYTNYAHAKLSGYLLHNKHLHEDTSKRFWIGAIYNIRNIENDVTTDTGGTAYNSIVNLNWEVIFKYELTISGLMLNPIYYNVSYSNTGHRNKRKFIANAGQDAAKTRQRIYHKEARSAYPGFSIVRVDPLTNGGSVITNAM